MTPLILAVFWCLIGLTAILIGGWSDGDLNSTLTVGDLSMIAMMSLFGPIMVIILLVHLNDDPGKFGKFVNYRPFERKVVDPDSINQ